MADAEPVLGHWQRSLLTAVMGLSAGLPYVTFSNVLLLRLTKNGIDIVVIGFFAWLALLNCFKFAWAPLLDRFMPPGFYGFWGKRRGWIMICQLAVSVSLAGLAFTGDDRNLGATALWALLVAFWYTTHEIASDAWRIDIDPDRTHQGSLVAAYLWGYRVAMVAASAGTLLLADRIGWRDAYLAIALLQLVPFLVLCLMPAAPAASVGRVRSLGAGLACAALLIMVSVTAGWAMCRSASAAMAGTGLSEHTNVVPYILLLCLLPFILLTLMIPRIRAGAGDSRLMLAPYVDLLRRYDYGFIGLMVFVAIYRLGDVLATTLAKPLYAARGYSLSEIGLADGLMGILAGMGGVALGGWAASRWGRNWSLVSGAVVAFVGNLTYAWLAVHPRSVPIFYLSAALEAMAHGWASAVFVAYLSLLTRPPFTGSQYAFLSAFAFLLPRLLAGASGAVQQSLGYAGFFILASVSSLVVIALLPLLSVRERQGRDDDHVTAGHGSLG